MRTCPDCHGLQNDELSKDHCICGAYLDLSHNKQVSCLVCGGRISGLETFMLVVASSDISLHKQNGETRTKTKKG